MAEQTRFSRRGFVKFGGGHGWCGCTTKLRLGAERSPADGRASSTAVAAQRLAVSGADASRRRLASIPLGEGDDERRLELRGHSASTRSRSSRATGAMVLARRSSQKRSRVAQPPRRCSPPPTTARRQRTRLRWARGARAARQLQCERIRLGTPCVASSPIRPCRSSPGKFRRTPTANSPGDSRSFRGWRRPPGAPDRALSCTVAT